MTVLSVYLAQNLILLALVTVDCYGRNSDNSSNIGFAAANIATGCPVGMEGYFVDPSSCLYYYECRFNASGIQTSVRQQCPSTFPYFVSSSASFGFCNISPDPKRTCPLQDNPQVTGPQSPFTIIPPYTGGGQDSGSFQCPTYLVCNRTSLNGLYGDPRSCTQYYLCLDYTAYQLTCPNGMQFSDTVNYCDWSYRANCNLQARQSQRYWCGNRGTSANRGSFLWRLLQLLIASTMILGYLSAST